MAASNKARQGIGALTLSVAALFGIAASEGYTDRAIIPVPGDVPTYGHGTTRHADGSPVRMGETTTPERAMQDLKRDASVFESAVKRCAPVPMFQHEFESMVLISYNIGASAFCNSTIVKRLKVGDYSGACDAFLMWNKVGGRVVNGLVIRRNKERIICLGQKA